MRSSCSHLTDYARSLLLTTTAAAAIPTSQSAAGTLPAALSQEADLRLQLQQLQRQPLALVLGHEVTGVDVNILALCDGVVEIPVYGVKNSLNVCSAATAAVFEALRQWKLIEGSAAAAAAAAVDEPAAAAAAGTRSRKRVRVGDNGLKSSADGNSSSDEVCC
jgi:tRNA C32,U32 (ribose-2'-O)-methylase TrmJ